jgi:hypothetical protein
MKLLFNLEVLTTATEFLQKLETGATRIYTSSSRNNDHE